MLKLHVTAAAVALAWAGHSVAQSTLDEEDLALAYGSKDFISIATGNRQPVHKAPSVATVIMAEDIAAMGAVDMDEVLEAVPGMHVSRASLRYASTYMIRGIGGGGQANPQVLLLQDGIPMTTTFNGDKGSAWRGTSIENIARIEIIRGPGSALYGADAYAGVINIITKTAQDAPGTEVGLRRGSFNTWDGWIQHGSTAGPVDVAAYLRLGRSDGFKETIAADAQTRNDRLFGTNASLAPGPINAGYDAIDGSLNLAYEKWRLRGGYKLRDHLGYGAGISSALVPGSEGKSELINSDLSWANPQFARDWGTGFSASYLQYSLTYPNNLMLLPPGTQLATGLFPQGVIGGPNQWERQFRISAFATYSGFADHNVRIGLGHDDLNLYKTKTYKNYLLNAAGTPVPTGPVIDYSDIQPFIQPQRRKVAYIYAQDEWKFARDWTLTAGLRHDDYSDFGATTNPRLAVVWEAAYNLTAKVLYGGAFRAPSFNEQYGINPVNNGNPSLQPERIRTLEGALSWQVRKDAQVTLSVFRYTMSNIIRPVANPAPTPGSTYQNAGTQTGDGAELEASWDATRTLRLSGYYAYQRSVDESTGHDAGYAPRHHVYARADWRMAPGWQLHTQVNYVADRKRAFGDNRPPVADYTTLDLTLKTDRTRDGWDFAASIRNFFDASVKEPTLAPGTALPDDLPMPGRSFWLQARYSL
ncbi:MAG TPA: TonB-dependent receptor [Rhodocyclaceae bacterium]|nr:TonB-dependent receptor [Rhodocyclaceae bacterium]